MRAGTGKSRSQYLLDLVFPDRANAPGPGVRSGDFAELLISDYVEFILGYWVPRGKYAEKGSRDETISVPKYKDEVEYLTAVLKNGAPETNAMMSLERNLKVVQLLDAARRSAKEGKKVVL